jgi:hypothetical protein
MQMPEAAVDEDGYSQIPENEIRFSENICVPPPSRDSVLLQERDHPQFRGAVSMRTRSRLPSALSVNLLFDVANDPLVMFSDPFRFIWIAALLTNEPVIRKITIAQKYRSVAPRFVAGPQTVYNLAEIETVDPNLEFLAHLMGIITWPGSA